jgi:hypothetical protein
MMRRAAGCNLHRRCEEAIRIKRPMAILAVVLAASSAFATAQFPDKLLYDGKEHSLYTNPMEPYFARYPDKKPTDGVTCTALWRGYVATFEILEKRLFLSDIKVMVMTKDQKGKRDTAFSSVKDTLIPEGGSLPADWFSGILVLPDGELVNYVHMGYASTYSNYILLEIRKGTLTEKRVLDHEAYEVFKTRQFEAYKRTDEYQKRAAELQNGKLTQEDIDSFLRSRVVSYTSAFLVGEEGAPRAEPNEPVRRRESWLVTGTESIVPVTPAKADGPELVSLELNAVPLSDVLRMFSGVGKAGDFSRYSHIHVTGSYTNVPWRDTLGQILSEHGLRLEEDKPGSGVLKVAPLADKSEDTGGGR